MERHRPITDITEHSVLALREKQVRESLEICDDARKRLDNLKGKADSGDPDAIRQLEIEGPQLEARFNEHRDRISKIVGLPLS